MYKMCLKGCKVKVFLRYGNIVLYGEGLKCGIFYDLFHVCVLCFDDIEIVCE